MNSLEGGRERVRVRGRERSRRGGDFGGSQGTIASINRSIEREGKTDVQGNWMVSSFHMRKGPSTNALGPVSHPRRSPVCWGVGGLVVIHFGDDTTGKGTGRG